MKKHSNGITLIVLVITIVVLLILAGVSISMLTGQNGILTQAQNARETNDVSATEEKVKLVAIAAKMQAETGTLDADKLVEEITTSYGGNATKSEKGFPITAEIEGKQIEINSDGNISIIKKINEITGNEEFNVVTQDNLGNRIVVPKGFKVVNSKDNVTKGIIIEDVSYEATKGSEFVWIPLGNIVKEDKTTKNIELNRYGFDNNGNVMEYSKEITEETSINHSGKYGNIIAKNIEDFLKKAERSCGYYVGRYEARTNVIRTSKTVEGELTQVTEKANEYIYNYITQSQSARLSREMYNNTEFESDLINSYAWETAILFFQTFDNRIDKTKIYSMQNSFSSNLEDKGTNQLKEESTRDVICNVYDMAGNSHEWTTSTYVDRNIPCTGRGGGYSQTNNHTSSYFGLNATYGFKDLGFRIILYL